MAIDKPESSHCTELEQELADIMMLEGIMVSEHDRIHDLHEDAFETAEALRRRYDL